MPEPSKALVWDKAGQRYYENGVDHCALYLQNPDGGYGTGVAWNGITGITESPDGAEANDLYADNMKYGSMRSAETFGGTIEAYTYPEEFGQCDGTAAPEGTKGLYLGQQIRTPFGLAYRTNIGNDTISNADDGYKLHLVYGCTASPSEKAYETINDSPDAITLSWEFDTTPVAVDGYKSLSTITIDSLKAPKAALTALEKKLFGDATTAPTLPLPSEVIEIFKTNADAVSQSDTKPVSGKSTI